MALEKNHYARLGIPVDATLEEIRHAYRECARRLHPDTNPEPGQTELFLAIQESYEVLADPYKRRIYDATLPKDFATAPPVTITATYSCQSLARVEEQQLVYVLLDLAAKAEAQAPPKQPLNLCLVIDTSTSMQGAILDTVKATAVELVRQLKPEDILSLVSFNDRAEVVVPGGMVIPRSQAETSIRMLHAGGGTEIYQGLQAGYNEVRKSLKDEFINHIILLTDGRTYGDEARCLRLADQATRMGIGISALGIGPKWNDTFLDKLSGLTGGSSQYVARQRDIRNYLQQKFSSLDSTFADWVSYRFETSPGVTLRYAFRLQPEVGSLEVESPISLGAIQYKTHLNVLLEFLVESVPANQPVLTVAEGYITVDIPSRPIPTFTRRLVLNRYTNNDTSTDLPPTKIIRAMSRLTLYRMQEKAHHDLEAGDVRGATRRLQSLATHLLSQGERELARAVLVEAAHIQEHQSFSEEGNKRIKYGTRSLLLPTSADTQEALNEDDNENESDTPGDVV